MRFVHWFACVYFLLCIPLFAFNRPDARLAVTDHSSTWHRLFAELTSIIPRPIARLCLLSALYTALCIQPSRRSPGCYRPLIDLTPIICRTHIDHSPTNSSFVSTVCFVYRCWHSTVQTLAWRLPTTHRLHTDYLPNSHRSFPTNTTCSPLTTFVYSYRIPRTARAGIECGF